MKMMKYFIRLDLSPNERADIILFAASQAFDRGTAHPEVGGGKHDGQEIVRYYWNYSNEG
jgi:hypothetical protein